MLISSLIMLATRLPHSYLPKKETLQTVPKVNPHSQSKPKINNHFSPMSSGKADGGDKRVNRERLWKQRPNETPEQFFERVERERGMRVDASSYKKYIPPTEDHDDAKNN